MEKEEEGNPKNLRQSLKMSGCRLLVARARNGHLCYKSKETKRIKKNCNSMCCDVVTFSFFHIYTYVMLKVSTLFLPEIRK